MDEEENSRKEEQRPVGRADKQTQDTGDLLRLRFDDALEPRLEQLHLGFGDGRKIIDGFGDQTRPIRRFCGSYNLMIYLLTICGHDNPAIFP